jgi:hypothetical protein
MVYAWCLPWSREEDKLASSKLGVFSKPAVSKPMQYDAWVLAKGRQGISKKQHGLSVGYLGNIIYNFLH